MLIEYMLQQYLGIQTVHPCRLGYEKVIAFFVNQAKIDGIEHTIVELDSGFPMLILSVPGTNKDLPALLLNHHMDVVSAQEGKWSCDPFAATIKDGYVYGRGIQDMKGVGVIHYVALSELKKEAISLDRSIYLSIVPGEECGGFDGTGHFIKTDFFKKMNIGYVLDEGIPSGCASTLMVMVDERSPLQLKITALGQAGHASKLMHSNSIYILIQFLNDLKILHDLSLANAKFDNPGEYSTYHVTWLSAGNSNSVNVIPSMAQAIVDIRVAPADSVDQVLDCINLLVQKHDGISYELLAVAKEKNKSKKRCFLKKYLENVIKDKGFISKSIIFEGASDMRFYRQLGIEAVGFSPFDDLPLLHTTDECLSLKSLYRGKDIIKALLYEFCMKGVL